MSLVQLCSHVFPFITIIQCISALSFPNFFVSSSSIPRVCFQSSSVTQFSSSCPYNKHRACSQLACESCIWSSLPSQHTWTRQARCFSHAWIQMFLFRGTNQRSAEQFQLYSFRHGQVLAASTETQLRDHLSSPAQFLNLLPSLTDILIVASWFEPDPASFYLLTHSLTHSHFILFYDVIGF